MTILDGVHGTVCNAQQYQQSLQSYHSDRPSISCLTPWDIVGLVLAAEASFFSFTCVIVIFIWMGWNVRWYSKKFPNGNWKLFREPAAIYMFSLFVFDFLQAIGGILNIRWVHNGIVTTGHYCTAQGLIKQIGDVGVALSSLFLAVHSFVTAVWRVGLKARGVAVGLVCLAFVFITLWVTIGAGMHKNYETPTPYWCWISPQFPGERLAGEYIWLLIALFASAMLYIPLYFWAESFWLVDDENKFHWLDPDQRVEYAERRATLGMLLYPLAYSLIVLPLTVARWLQFSNYKVPPAVTFFGDTMFCLSGAINVLLFLIIRPGLLLFPRPEELAEPEIKLAPQEPTSAALDGGSRNSPTQSRVSLLSDDI